MDSTESVFTSFVNENPLVRIFHGATSLIWNIRSWCQLTYCDEIPMNQSIGNILDAEMNPTDCDWILPAPEFVHDPLIQGFFTYWKEGWNDFTMWNYDNTLIERPYWDFYMWAHGDYWPGEMKIGAPEENDLYARQVQQSLDSGVEWSYPWNRSGSESYFEIMLPFTDRWNDFTKWHYDRTLRNPMAWMQCIGFGDYKFQNAAT